MSLYVGCDPGFSNIGIVALKTGSDIPVEADKFKYDPTTTDEAKHETWFSIGYEVGECLSDIKQDFSPKQAMVIGMLAPIQTDKRGSCLKIHVASGVIFGVCMQYGIATMARDAKVRRTLGPLIGCPLKFEKPNKKGILVKSASAATEFVQGFWPDCSNEHLAMAWLMAKYMSIVHA